MAVAHTCVLLHFVYWGATMHIRRSEGNLQKAVLSFYHCRCWGSDSGHQVVNRHLSLLSHLAALAVLLWGLSEAALGGEHVAGPQWPKSPSTPHLLIPKLGTMPWTCGPLGDTPDTSGRYYIVIYTLYLLFYLTTGGSCGQRFSWHTCSVHSALTLGWS